MEEVGGGGKGGGLDGRVVGVRVWGVVGGSGKLLEKPAYLYFVKYCSASLSHLIERHKLVHSQEILANLWRTSLIKNKINIRPCTPLNFHSDDCLLFLTNSKKERVPKNNVKLWCLPMVHGGDAVMRVGVKVESGGQEHEVAG